MEPKYLMIVKQPLGIVIRDTPRPESQGGHVVRTVAVGTQLYAYLTTNIDGVPYALLVPQNPQRPEWIRVAEADHSKEYVDVYPLDAPSNGSADLVAAINNLADAIRHHS